MRLGRLRRCSWELKFSPWPAKATCCTSLYNYHCCLIQLRICWGEPVSHIQWCSRLVEREQSCWGPEGELHVACTERPHTVFCKYNRPKTVFNFWIGSVAPAEFCKALADDSFLNALGVFGSLGASRSTCIDFENMMTTGWLEKSKWKSWEIRNFPLNFSKCNLYFKGYDHWGNGKRNYILYRSKPNFS